MTDNRDLVRAAAYQQVREDLKGRQGSKTKKKVNCTPPNVQCGGRCIPPTWDCRLKGQGTNSELKVHSQDISAGIASIQRGGVDLVKGAGSFNPARFERGRRSLIRGAVKVAPGDNLEKKKALRRRLDKHTNGIAAVVSIGLAVSGGYLVGRKALPSKWRNAIETPAKSAFNGMLDRAPFFAGRRAEIRGAGGSAAGGLGVAAIRESRLTAVAKAAAGNVGGIGPLGFRTRSMDTFESNLVGQMDAVAKKKGSFESWKSEAAQTLFGAEKGPSNARHSVYSDRAANEFIKAQYGLTDVRAKEAVVRGIGNQADPFTQAARNKGIEAALGDRINAMGADFRQDMRVRGIVSRDTYIKQVGMPAVQSKIGKNLTGSARANALDTARATMIAAIDGTGATQAKKIRTEAVTGYDTYFRDVALKTRRFAGNPLNRESPMGDVNIALARFEISRKTGMQPQILSRDHGDLLLRQHWHKSVQKQKSSLTIADGTAQRVAKTLTRSTTTPTPERAFAVLQANKIDVVRATATPTRNTRLTKSTSFSQLAKAIRERAGNEGMSMQASYEAAKREMNWRKEINGDRMDDEHMAPTITKRNPPSPLVTNSSVPVVGGDGAREHLPQSDDEMVTPLVPVSSMSEAPSPKEAEQQERPKPSGTVKIELKLEIPASAVKTDAMPPRVAAYLQTREDLWGKSSGTGKKCGNSHIPRTHTCNIGKAKQAKAVKTAKTVATAAAVVGVAAGAAAVATNPKLRQRARVEGKLLARGTGKRAEQADRVVRTAFLLGGRGTVAGLSSKQVKAGLDKIPEKFQGPARQLVGNAKKAAAAISLRAENYQVQDIDVVNNFSTWKDKTGNIISIGSYGDSIVTYASAKSHRWNGKDVYKIGFNVDQSFDATRDIPTAQAKKITGAVKKMTDNQLAKVDNGILATFPWDGDEYGKKRRAIYTRAGFNNIVGEDSQWALVEKGKIKKMKGAESFVYLAESGERDAPIYKPAGKRKDSLLPEKVSSGSR